MTAPAPLVLVSNRGPVTFEDDGSLKRGTGGLVTALTGLATNPSFPTALRSLSLNLPSRHQS